MDQLRPGLSVLTAATFTAWIGVSPLAAVAQPLVMPPTASAERGASLYAENCASCHGANLEGQENWQSPGPDGILPAPPHDVTGHTWHHGDGLLFDYIDLGGAAALEKNGVTGFKSGMPGFGDVLTEQDIWDILAFIKSTWPEQARQIQESRTQAEQLEGN